MSFFRRLIGPEDDKQDQTEKQETAPAKEDKEQTDQVIEETPVPEKRPEPESTPVISPLPDFGATRQLPAEKVISVNNARLHFGQASDVGMMRTNNEDAVLSFFSSSSSVDDYPDFGIFVVADGMGGHFDGEKASAIATRVVANEVINQIYLPILSGEGLSDLPPITEMIISAIQKANAEVFKTIPKGGGTTCSAVAVLGDRAYIGHVGDSRVYLITKEGIEQISRDHSLVQRLVDMGSLTQEEAKTHPRGNELYRALGFKDAIEVDAMSRRLPPNAKVLICSDGLWNLLPDDDILSIINSYPSPQEACNKLVAMANTRGGSDNITVILLRTG